MKISAAFLVILLTRVLNSEVNDQETNLKSDIEYIAPSDVKCMKCSPGTYLHSHCVTNNTNSSCRPCEDGTFTSEYNIAEYCDSCRKYCENPDLVPVVNCSSSSNLICECPDGKFNLFPHLDKYHAVCESFGRCEPGYGVYAKGTSVKNTTCVRCVSGRTFSSTTSDTEECQPCTNCDTRGILSECTLIQDRKCNLEPPVQRRVSSTSTFDWVLVLAIALPIITLLGFCILIIWLRKSKRCCFSEGHTCNADEVMIHQFNDESSQNNVSSSQRQHLVNGDQRPESTIPLALTNEAPSRPSTSSQPSQTPAIPRALTDEAPTPPSTSSQPSQTPAIPLALTDEAPTPPSTSSQPSQTPAIPLALTYEAPSPPSTSSQPSQTPQDSWGSSVVSIRQSVSESLIEYGSWEFVIREFHQVSTTNCNSNIDAKIAEIKTNYTNNVKEQIYQCLTFICERGATPDMLIDVLIRKEYHSLVAKLHKKFPHVFKPGESKNEDTQN